MTTTGIPWQAKIGARTLHCPQCKSNWTSNASGVIDCPACGVTYDVVVFDALIHPPLAGSNAGDALATTGEASCFYHTGKKAVVPCDACGRFICGLCDMDLAGKHFCPACLEKGRTSHSLAQVDTYRFSYPDIALLLALAPVIIWPITIFTAPAAIYAGIRGWKKPPSLTGRKKRLRTVFAVAFALLQLCVWVALFVTIFTQVSRLL